ncbi:MAG: DUF6456 domain-containing protein [Pseudomonadota bacterium]
MKSPQSARLHDERLLRSLLASDGVIRGEPLSEDWPAYVRGDKRKRPLFWVNCADVDRLVADGALIATKRGIRVSSATRRRLRYGVSSRELEERVEYVPSGVERPVRRDVHGSVIDRMARRTDSKGQAYLTDPQITAAQRYTRALLTAGEGRVGTSATMQPRVDGTRRHDSAERRAIARIDATESLRAARLAVGADMARLLDAICGANERLEAIERAERWSRGTGLVVLRMALDLLSRHYGTVPGELAIMPTMPEHSAPPDSEHSIPPHKASAA